MNQPNQAHVTYVSQDGIVGRFSISNTDPQKGIEALTAIEANFAVTPLADLVRLTAGPQLERDAIQMRERSIAELRVELQKQAEFLATLTLRETEATRKAREDLEQTYRENQAKLETEHLARQAALDERLKVRDEEFAARERAFEDRKSKFETREAKVVRRQLLEEIKKVLTETETLTLSSGTERKRRLTHVCVAVLVIASGSELYGLLGKLVEPGSVPWYLMGSIVFASFTLISTVVYYLRWNDRWYREHADGELAAKRYKADILRASWIAELVSELATEGRPELPPELLDAFTRNLFRDTGRSRVTEHPFDDLTSLFKRANEVTIGGKMLSLKAASRGGESKGKGEAEQGAAK
jgi:hypothetical protein